MPLEIVRNDITTMQVDAIVNAANSSIQKGGGVCGAIFSAAGATELQGACDEIGSCSVGEAVSTEGFQLPAKKIIHTVGPIWQGGNANEENLLVSCYRNSLELAVTLGCNSIAFPLISSGIYGYPKEQALQVALKTIREFIQQHEISVYLVVFDKEAFSLSAELHASISEYIDEHYVDEQEKKFGRIREAEEMIYQQSSMESVSEPLEAVSEKRSLDDVLGQLEESFSQSLLRLIDQKSMTDVETYKKANIDRKLFSKIRNTENYNPMKKTVLAFAVALELNLDETLDLLGKAGYTLSRSNKFDVILEYFIERGNYNVFEINEALFSFDQMTLGA
ncbi:macro domain-containing protein [Sporosarcina sp. CAU 1771]